MIDFGSCPRISSYRSHRLLCSAALAVLAAVACSRNPQPDDEPAGPAVEPKPSRPGGGGEQHGGAGATQSLDTGDGRSQPVQSVEELIQGRFAGVQVVRVPGGFSLRIRGAGSLTGQNEPLYVLDGVALAPAPGGALLGVDPRDIQRIEVLKDAASTSAYGVRGANGVILIWTRRAP